MKTVVVYYSLQGNVRYVAEKVSKGLNADLIELVPVKAYPDKGAKKFLWGGKSSVMKEEPELLPYSFNSVEYDTIIIGTPVWASNMTPPIRSFIKQNREQLKQKRIAVAVCFSGGGANKAISRLADFIGIEKFISELILIDPKDKPDPENDNKIEQFVTSLS